jgi:hypothetical protein
MEGAGARRRYTTAFVLVVGAGLGMLRCGATPSDDPIYAVDAPGDAAPSVEAGPCSACVSSQCDAPLIACARDPLCAPWLRCVASCDYGPACVTRCPLPIDAPPAAREALRCIEGARCEGCGRSSGVKHPVLREVCGADAGDLPDVSVEASCSTAPGDPDCPPCIRAHCCETRQRLFADISGDGLLDCLRCCRGTTFHCSEQCFAKWPSAVTEYLHMITCSSYHCPTSCAAANACLECQFRHCADEYAELNEGAERFLGRSCVATCGRDLPCIHDCLARFPDTRGPLARFTLCGVEHCADECN